MKRLYCLFTITHNTHYTTIQGCEPTEDYELLENIRGLVSVVKKPSRSAITEILETDERCVLTEAGQSELQEIRKQLS